MKRWSKRVVKVGGKDGEFVMVYDGSATNISQFSTDTKRSYIKKKEASINSEWLMSKNWLLMILWGNFFPLHFLPHSTKTLSNPGKAFL